MKVIFLDFDGTVNNPGCYTIASGLHAPAHPPCIEALNHITDATGAQIVVSSTWRIALPLIKLRELLHDWGATGVLISATPQLFAKRAGDSVEMQQPRGLEIQKWLEDHEGTRHEPEAFVILDDESDLAPLNHRLVRTNGHTGLTMADAERAIKLLGERR